MYQHEGVSEGISSIGAADTHTTLYTETSLTSSGRKDVTTAESSIVQSDKPAADKPLSPLPESNEIRKSSSKVFHKKYNTKGRLLEIELLGGRSHVPWRKKEWVGDKGSCAKSRENKKAMSPKCLFAKQAERARQKEKWEKKLKQSLGKLLQQKHFKKGKKCSLDKEKIEEPAEASDMEEKPCRVCMSGEEYDQAMKSSDKGGDHDQPGVGSKHGHRDLKKLSKEYAEEVGVLDEQDPGMLTLLDQDVQAEIEADAMEAAEPGFREKQGDQQTAWENRSVMKAITRLLREIPVDLLSKVSTLMSNVPCLFKNFVNVVPCLFKHPKNIVS